MASSALFGVLAPIVICLFLAGSVITIPQSILKNIEFRQEKMCQIDSPCNNCSLEVERELLLKQSKLLAGQLEKTEQGLLASSASSEADELCALPKLRDPQQYCCEMWAAFDCRTRIASEKCTFHSFVRFRRYLFRWAHDLMLFNVCVDFDYGSTECQQHQQAMRIERSDDSQEEPIPSDE